MAGELVHASVGTALTQAEYEATTAHTMTWADWTPTVTQSVSVTVTVTEAKYAIIGKVCHIYAKLTCTSAGTAANDIIIGGQPAAAQPAVTGLDAGVGHVLDNGSANYRGILNIRGTTDFRLIDTSSRVEIGTNPNFALANTDTIDFSATYRIS